MTRFVLLQQCHDQRNGEKSMFEIIGTVKSSVTDKIDHNWGEIISEILINEELTQVSQKKNYAKRKLRLVLQ